MSAIPLFSIVVPTRNRPHLLEHALAAIDSQEFRDFETIVVDDGSDAAAKAQYADLFASLRNKPVLVELASSNPFGNGPSFVRNAGIAAAKGDLIAFCDDDDFWCDTRHLTVAAECFSAEETLDYYFANQRACLNGTPTSEDWLPSLTANLSGRPGDADGVHMLTPRDVLIEGHFPHLNTTICRKAHLASIDGLWEGVRYSEDLDFFIRAADAARKIAFRNAVIATHNIPDRTRSDNASTRLNEAQKLVVMVHIADHLRLTCRHREALHLACQHEGWSYKKLAEYMAIEGRNAAALQYALRGLAALPTLGWTVKVIGLGLKNLVSKT